MSFNGVKESIKIKRGNENYEYQNCMGHYSHLAIIYGAPAA